MDIDSDYAIFLREAIAATDEKLRELAREIERIPKPASQGLRNRLHALQIEEAALQRIFVELCEGRLPADREALRFKKVGILLHHIEDEEAVLEQDAHFFDLSGARDLLRLCLWPRTPLRSQSAS